MTPLQRITDRLARTGDQNDPDAPRALLTLDEFFEGNEVDGCIGCNLPGAPGPQVIHAALKAIARRPEVHDVRVMITMFDDPDWPFSDVVYVITSASPEEVASWFEEDLAPDDTSEGFDNEAAYEPYEVPQGLRVICCWWD